MKHRKILRGLAAAAFWLCVWEALSLIVGSKWLLPAPLDTVRSLAGLAVTAAFWKTVWTSFFKIALGFLAAVLLGSGLALAAFTVKAVNMLVSPLMRLIKAVPVASFIILILLWVSSSELPFVISMLMVLPVIYINVLAGFEAADPKLLEMSRVFGMRPADRLRYIYLPAVGPHFVSACSVGLGFCWKSGIAAEVIGLSPMSIGRNLYNAKLYLMTDELFAWTVVIVAISVLFEKLVMLAVRRIFGYAGNSAETGK